MDGSGELQCVGKMEIAQPKPVGFLCGTLPVPTDSTFPLFQSAIVPSPHTTGAPRYQMLPVETDLNTPPDAETSEEIHWERGSINHNLSRKCEALAVSGLTEYGDEIDVVAPTDILKQIFKIPYSKGQLSIAVHRVGDTLILNTGPDVEEGEKLFRRQSNQPKASSDPSIFLNFARHSVRAEACDCPPTHHPSEKQSSSTMLPGEIGNKEDPFLHSSNSHVSKSQFLDHSVSNSRESTHTNHNKYLWGTKQNKQRSKKTDSAKKASQVGEKTRRPVQESDKFRNNNGFLRVLFWQFHNFRMLLGSDLLIFSNEKYVAVSLHLWDFARQVTPLTWLEAWLDNVMANVPELAICYHQNGVVQGYELLKTDDIFLLKGISDDGTPAFHPQVVQKNGLAVLRFLQDNCKQDPGAYWLYKSAGDDVIQLFDLSVIPGTGSHSVDDHKKSRISLPAHMHKGRRESLFSLGTLLYRVAHRLSLSKAPDNRAKCAEFFKKCLDFLHEQDHLVVRAYAHEQFARLILACYEEFELKPESFLLEYGVSVTDLEDGSSEISPGMFGSTSQDKELSQYTEGTSLAEDETTHQSSETKVSDTSEATEVGDTMGSASSSIKHDNLEMSEVSSTPHLVRTVVDPISSKLAAVHHVSQAIKSLRWKRQLQNAQGEQIDYWNRTYETSSSSFNFSSCSCGDADCIEVCDIREWLPKSKMDRKMWNLILLLGEAYLALGETYKDDGRLQQALKVVELACLLYGSMPQHLEDAQFLSSMIDGANNLNLNHPEEGYSAGSPAYLFWVKAWMLVGDVYVEYHRTRGKDIPIQAERKTSGSELQMSNEIMKEVKHLKDKLGKFKKNCTTCSLINCSCLCDRASSGNSASSSNGDASASYGRKPSRKNYTRNSPCSSSRHIQDDNLIHKLQNDNCPEGEDLQNHNLSAETSKVQENENAKMIHTVCPSEDKPKVRDGGIFKFIKGPKSGDIEYNLSAAIDCYNEARKALGGYVIGSPEYQSVMKRKGWACNELGRYRLENNNLASAEIAFVEAVTAFKEVSDHANMILINCNLGHGRRALAEEMLSKMDKLKQHGLLQNAYKQAVKTAKLEYAESLRYYGAAKTELDSINDNVDPSLCNEARTQYAHTYLRLGMLLAREGISTEALDKKEQRKHEISANEAFREALSIYESLGDLRKQEAAFTHFQLACYHRDMCLEFVDLDRKQIKISKCENSRQRIKWYASLAEKNWQKALDFYGPRTHPVMYLNILLEQSALSVSLVNKYNSNTMMEAALMHLLEGRHVVEESEAASCDEDSEFRAKFWNQLQTLLKSMLSASLSGNTSKTQARAGDAVKLKEMYRISLKSTGLGQLHHLYKLWAS